MELNLNTVLGVVVSSLLTILLVQMRGQRKDTKGVGEKLDQHILEITKALAFKVNVDACKNTRSECIALNHKIIRAPLESEIKQIHARRRKRWQQQADDNKAMWKAIRGHTHTGLLECERDKVIILSNGG
jgi:low affinity Fe/Cu permease